MSATTDKPKCPWSDGSQCPYVVPGNAPSCAAGDPTVTSLDEYRRRRADAPSVLCVGVSFRATPIEIRERLALTPYAISATLARAGCQHEPGTPKVIEELAIVATCNRLEFYATGSGAAPQALVELFREATGMTAGEAGEYLYVHEGVEAVRHLSRVASGLESMVVGEAQILGQVSEAFSQSTAHGACHTALSTVFRGAIRAGRRARVETAINRSPATVSSVAVTLASETIRDLEHATVVIVGAGEMAELAANALKGRGVSDIRIVSRTHQHASALAERVGGQTLAYEELEHAIAAADIVISSTAAPHIIITREMVENAMHARASRPLFFIDIALPRDVDPAVAEIANVEVHDIDDLQRHVTVNLAERQSEIPAVERIVEEETEIAVNALRQLGIAPLIADLRAHADEIRRGALDAALKGLGHLSEKDRKRVEAFSQSLLNKLLHEPTLKLKNEAGTGRATEYASAVRELFGLTEQPATAKQAAR